MTKAAKNPKQNTATKLVAAALKLAATHSWSSLTFVQIAKAAKVSPEAARKVFADKNQLLPAIVLYFDNQTESAIGKPLKDGTPRDRLFEVIMARMDALQQHRKAVLNIMDAVKHEPRLLVLLLPAHKKAIKGMLLLSSLPANKAQQPLVTLGLLAIYSATLYRWRFDNTPDLSKTMAALDRSLRLGDKISEILLRTI